MLAASCLPACRAVSTSPSHPSALGRFAPGLFVLLWGSGFIGAKFGLPHAPPFTFLLVRLLLTTAVLLAAAWLWRQPWPRSLRETAPIVVVGLLVHGVYLGGVFAGIAAGVSAGMASLIAGLQPLLTAALAGRWLGERVGPRQWLGLLLGLCGVLLVVWRTLGFAAGDLLHLLPVVAALLGITIGTLAQKRYCAHMNIVTGTAIQYVAAAAAFAAFAFGRETMVIDWTGQFVAALLWLSLGLSVGAIFLLFYLIRHGEAARVASLFYLVPATTAVLAWLLFDETLPPLALAGFVLSAAGVALARQPAGPAAEARWDEQSLSLPGSDAKSPKP
jgi:drug/metabolite transporter (DMT)-like permease